MHPRHQVESRVETQGGSRSGEQKAAQTSPHNGRPRRNVLALGAGEQAPAGWNAHAEFGKLAGGIGKPRRWLAAGRVLPDRAGRDVDSTRQLARQFQFTAGGADLSGVAVLLDAILGAHGFDDVLNQIVEPGCRQRPGAPHAAFHRALKRVRAFGLERRGRQVG